MTICIKADRNSLFVKLGNREFYALRKSAPFFASVGDKPAAWVFTRSEQAGWSEAVAEVPLLAFYMVTRRPVNASAA